MSTSVFTHLLAPGRIGPMDLPNRIIVTAMGVNLAEDGFCGARIRAFYEEFARGGAGLVNVGVAGVAWPVGSNLPRQVAISDDRFIPGIREMADAVHAHGAKFALQLHHGGLVGMEDMLAGRPVWTPSVPSAAKGDFSAAFLHEELQRAPSSRIKGVQFRVLSIDDIRLVVEQFAAAAVRARQAGADGVEIHGGHGYLLSSFVSPRSNKRSDEYGGSLENRARFLLEVVRAVRAAVDDDFAVWCKIDAQEFGTADGITVEDAIQLARWLEQAGAHAITVSSYHDTGQPKLHSGSNIPHEPCLNLPAAERIKDVLRIPVIASGRVEPAIGESKIRASAFDFLALGRKLLADPFLPRKLAAGRAEDIRPCIYCYTCVSAIYTGDSTRCAVNSACGFEYLREPRPRPQRQRHVVIGGGPGGMEAACRLAEQGHEVILLEAGKQLGGTLPFAALAYEANQRLLEWLRRRVAASTVEVRLDTCAGVELVSGLKPATVLVATGAVREMPPIPGAELAHVFSGDDMRRLMLGQPSDELQRKLPLATRFVMRIATATGLMNRLGLVRWASHLWMPLGKRVTIIGGELVGIELAEYLAERGREVNVIDEAPRFGAGLTLVRRMRALEELKEHGVGLFMQATSTRIEPRAVHFIDSEGSSRSVAADHVIVARGATGDTSLADALRAAGHTVHAFGDCTGVSYIEGALRGAADTVELIARG